jgi:S-adenosylmethionine:tRNA ribosyltransferase-isomerase
MHPDFLDYDLPPHLIAQQPPAERDRARLLVARRADGSLAHHLFRDLPELLDPGDLLVLNDTRVLPARLVGRRERTGGRWEGLFLRERPDGRWELLGQSRGTPKPGEFIAIEPGPLRLRLVDRLEAGGWLAEPVGGGTALELLGRHGRVPLPPYIRKGEAGGADAERYQTVYAREPGAVAAPTAGLHFTPAVFDRLRARGIDWGALTLHVGLGTFQPIRADDYRDHPMHREWYDVPPATAEAICKTKRAGRRVVAVGTTAVRALESAARSGPLQATRGETDLFIYPPYEFKVINAMVTNFHLPRTTLLLLVGALAGTELLRSAYREAVAREYRFYSYGDAMLVL